MRKLILLMLIGISTSLLQAQSEKDALRYSFLTHGGTARYVGMSGAFGALGADFSSISTNPAGLGSFRSSSVMFSPTFEMNGVDADYKNKLTTLESPFVNMNNFGFVINFKSQDMEANGWKTVSLGLGYNKLKSFNQEYTIKGYNNQSSRLDQFMLNSDGLIPPDDLYSAEYTIYNVYLIDTLPNTGMLFTHPYYNKYYIDQSKNVKTAGSVGEFVIGIGGNYNDVLQVGFSLGLQNINYTEKSTFSEYSDSTDLISWDFTEKLATKGTGVNFKLGMIYRPVEFIRIGAAFHTPTFYSMKDIYSYEASSHFYTPDSYGKKDYTDDGDGEMEYSYELYTPMRAVASIAAISSKIGIISFDYEYVNYGKARLRAVNDDDFEPENNNIKEFYKEGHNFRLGAEFKLSPLYLRGGASYYSSPDRDGNYSATQGYSFGAGLRTKNTFVDFGFNQFSNKTNYQLYEYEYGIENSKLKFNNSTYCFTIGFSF